MTATGVTEKNIIQTIHDTLHDEMKRDDRMVILGEDVGARGGVFRATMGFLEEFGDERVIDTPLDECLIAGVSIGLALDDMRPVAEFQFADFIFPGFNQIVQEAARIRYRSNSDFGLPLVMRTPWGGGVHGALYHSQSIEAFFAHVPGLKVVAPSTPEDAKGMLIQAIEDRRSRPLPRAQEDLPPGQGRRSRRAIHDPVRQGEGRARGSRRHLCVVRADAPLLPRGCEPAGVGRHRGRGHRPAVIYPLDMDTVLESVGKTNKAMIVYEDNKFLGVGAEVSAQIAERALFELDGPVVRIGAPHVPAMPYAPTLEHWFLPDPDRIEQEMRKLAEY